jgi:ABC-type transport system substrate-binding protein
LSSVSQAPRANLYLDWYYGLDPDVLFLTLHSTAGGGGGFNFTFYKSSALDNLIDIGRSTLNLVRARQAYVAVQRFSDKNVLTDPLWQTVGLWGMHSNIHGFHTDSTGLRPIYADLYETK